jgi:hypothetical protein
MDRERSDSVTLSMHFVATFKVIRQMMVCAFMRAVSVGSQLPNLTVERCQEMTASPQMGLLR